MYTRKATLSPTDVEDRTKMPEFIHMLRTHSMYNPILQAMFKTPGFVKKEYSMVDTLDSQIFKSSVTFDSKESFDNYINEESNQSIWEFLELLSIQNGFNFTLEDYEGS